MGKINVRKTIIILLIIVFVASLAYIVYSTLTKKSTTELYLEAESKNFDNIIMMIDDYYTDLMDKQKPYMESASRSRTEFTAQIGGGTELFGFELTGQIPELLNKTKLIVDTRRQPQDEIAVTKVDLMLERAPFLNAELFVNNKILWFAVPDIMPDRYISVERERLNDVYDRFSIPVKPLEQVTGKRIAESLVFDKEPLQASMKKVGSIFTKYLTDETVIYNGKHEYKIDGATIEGDEMNIFLNEGEASSFFKELLTTISEDEVLSKHIYGSYANTSTLLDNAGLFQLLAYLDETGAMGLNDDERGIVDVLGTGKDIDRFNSRLREFAADYRLKDGVIMKVVIDKAGNILQREIMLDLNSSKGAASFKVDLYTGSSNLEFNDARNRSISIAVVEYYDGAQNGSAGKTMELSVVPMFEGTGKSGADTGKVGIMYAVTGANKIRNQMDIDLEVSERIDQATQKINKKISFEARISGETGDGSMDGLLDSVSWSNKKLNTSNYTTGITFNADLPFLGINDFSAQLNIANEDSLGIDNFSLPDMRREVVTDLYIASDKELEDLETEVMLSFGSFYLNNKYIFDALLGSS
jgi:hypothetical protein